VFIFKKYYHYYLFIAEKVIRYEPVSIFSHSRVAITLYVERERKSVLIIKYLL